MKEKIKVSNQEKTKKESYLNPWHFFKYLIKEYQDVICKHQNHTFQNKNNEQYFFEKKFYPLFDFMIYDDDFLKIENEKHQYIKYYKLEEDLKIYKKMLQKFFEFKFSLLEDDFHHQGIQKKMKEINLQVKLINEKKQKIIDGIQKSKNTITNKIDWLKFNILGLNEYINILLNWREPSEKLKIKIKKCKEKLEEEERKLNRVLTTESLDNIKKISVNTEKTLKKIQETAKNSENATLIAQKTTKWSLILITFGTLASIIVMITSVIPYV